MNCGKELAPKATMQLQKIFCPTDFSPAARAAEQQAARLARTHGAELLLYHAVPTHSGPGRGFGELLHDYLAQAEAQVTTHFAREAEELERAGIEVKCVVERSVNAFSGIVAQALSFEADLMVLATHAGGGEEQTFLGSVSGKVLRHAPCSVMTVRPGAGLIAADAPKRVLIPVDFSDGARRAVDVARSLMSERDELVVLHVVHNPSHTGDYAGGPIHVFELDGEIPRKLSNEIDTWLGGQPCEIEVREGHVAATVLEVARRRDADLMVMGTRGLTGIDYLMLGSVAEKVVCGASVPVVVAK
jgi:nucleotide-binding universal stress UspA family protein